MKKKITRAPLLCVYPHRLLESKAEEVTIFDETLLKKIELLKGVMGICRGVGIAANQCFLQDSIFVTNYDNNIRVFINPVIESVGGHFIAMDEGCLSLPDFIIGVTRNSQVTLKYQNEKGEIFVEEFNDFPAVVIQHEMDHLNGKTILDNASKLRYNIAIRHFKKLKKKYGLL